MTRFDRFLLIRRGARLCAPLLALGATAASLHAHGGSSYPAGSLGGPISVGVFGSPTIAGQVITDSRDGQWDLPYGVQNFGGKLGAKANATRSYVAFTGLPDSASNYRSSASLYGTVRILNQTKDVANLDVSAKNEPYTLGVSGAAANPGYKPETALLLKLMGNTVFTASVASTTLSKTWSLNLGPYNSPSYSTSLSLGFASISVAAQAGASAFAQLTATADLASVSLTLDGEARSHAYGSASATGSVLGAKATVSAALDFGGPEIDLDLSAALFTGVGGSLEVCSPAISLLLTVYGELRFMKKVIASKTWTLVNYVLPASCHTFTF